MKFKVLLGLVILTVFGVTLLWWYHDRLGQALLEDALHNFGVDVLQLDTVDIGLTESAIDHLVIREPHTGLVVSFVGMVAEHGESDLLKGRVSRLHVDRMDVSAPGDAKPAIPNPYGLLDLHITPWLKWLPSEGLTIDQLQVNIPDRSPIGLNLEMWPDMPGRSATLAIQSLDHDGQLKVSANDGVVNVIFSTSHLKDGLQLHLSAPGIDGRRLEFGGDARVLKPWGVQAFDFGPCRIEGTMDVSRNPLEPLSLDLDSSECQYSGIGFSQLALTARLNRQEDYRLTSLIPVSVQASEISYEGVQLNNFAWQSPIDFLLHDTGLQMLLLPGAGGFDALRYQDHQIVATTLVANNTQQLSPVTDLNLDLHMNTLLLAGQPVGMSRASVQIQGREESMDVTLQTDRLVLEQDGVGIELDATHVALRSQTGKLNGTIKSNLSGALALDGGFSLQQGRLDLGLNSGTLAFTDNATASDLIIGWPRALDLVTGTIRLQLDVHQEDDEAQAILRLSLQDIGGYYDEMFFSGLNGNASLDLLPGLASRDAIHLSIEKVDIGATLSQVNGKVSIDQSPDNLRIQVMDLAGELFDGRFEIPVLGFSSGDYQEQQVLEVSLQNLNLALMAGNEQFPGLDMAGRLSGNIPVILAEDIRIDSGILFNKGSGFIKYDTGSDSAGLDGAEILFKALKMFEYDVLTVEPVYQPDGTLILKLHVEGVSEEIGRQQPIHFNINLEQNVHKLFESIRLVNGLNEDIDQRVNDFYQKRNQ